MVAVRKTVTVLCPVCEYAFALAYHPVDGQIITCFHCQIELEVINEHPLEVDRYDDAGSEDEDQSRF